MAPPADTTRTGRYGVIAGDPYRREAREYAKHFATVESGSTFYGTLRVSTVERWRKIASKGFLLAAEFSWSCGGGKPSLSFALTVRGLKNH